MGRKTFFSKKVDGFTSLTILAKSSILDVWQGPEYTSAMFPDFNPLTTNVTTI